ncbi:winged helix-turn-helix transcriptional regulator [Bradyrhizobium diazoefficiens]|uniref:MarR family winged helix-turn-helix transcriptional regulator n=1 Tax=Bradyrhizobium diazoefficiens TaxID=1355477 RepID=UPI00190B52DB|nr:MarR family winged helix-turn-helix transcriptional regulator [Bradyrhizobium diazoefficiens]MBK3666524.1 winged helix-turn-helix transcriptional regulator [Bradyrhizobium diazoefficiens]
MARLPKLMSTDRATTGYNLRPLVRDSFVEISVGENDRRERIVSVTKQGHKTDACALAAWRRAQTAFEDTMGEREAADMRDLMDRIVDVPLPASSPSREPVCRSRIERAPPRGRSIGSAKEILEKLQSCRSQADQEKMIAIFFFDFASSR